MQEKAHKWVCLQNLGKAMPYIVVLVIVFGFGVTFAFSMADLAFKALYLVMPVLLGFLFIFMNKRNKKVYNFDDGPVVITANAKKYFMWLIMVYIFLYICSIILLLVFDQRQLSYFLIISLISVVLPIEVLYTDINQKIKDCVVLIQIVFLQLNLIWGVNLKYFFYFGYTDIFEHMHYILTILSTSHVTEAMDYYEYAPLYHIFVAMGTEIIGWNAKDSFFLITALVYVSATIFVYLILRLISKNSYIPLMGCLFFAISREIIFHGTYMVTRSMGLIIVVIMLYLLLKDYYMVAGKKTLENFKKTSKRSERALKAYKEGNATNSKLKLPLIRCLLLLFTFCLILTHQTTTIFIGGILLILYVIEFMLYGNNRLVSTTYLILFACASIAHHIYLQFVVMESVILLIQYQLTHEIFSGALPLDVNIFLLNNVDFMISVFLLFIGVTFLLSVINPKQRVKNIIILFSFIAILCYIPSPVALLGELLLSHRLALLVTPFISIVLSYGLFTLYKSADVNKSTIKRVMMAIVIVGLVGSFSFFSIVNSVNSSDLNISWLNIEGDLFFSENEIISFSFFVNNAEQDATLYSDFYSQSYFKRYLHRSNAFVLTQPDLDYITHGYIILRLNEIEKKKPLLFCAEKQVGIKGLKLYRYTSDPNNVFVLTAQSKQKIYSGPEIEIYYQNV